MQVESDGRSVREGIARGDIGDIGKNYNTMSGRGIFDLEHTNLHIAFKLQPLPLSGQRITPCRDVQDGALASFPDAAAAQGTPLAEALFAIFGVKMVDVSGAVVAVVKTDDSN